MSMRVAIAGGGGFAYILAREIAQSANAVLVLSTQQHPEFEELGIQVATVDYTNAQELRYTLKGVDLLISTFRDAATQRTLIDAALHARVRTFVPSGFEGPVAQRPSSTLNQPCDQRSSIVRNYLTTANSHAHHPMRLTVFSCGVFYERFLPGGLGRLNMGRSANIWNAGDYLLNIETAKAKVVRDTAYGAPVILSMTSVYDVAKYVAAAVEIGPDRWPREFRMRGDQMTVADIVSTCSTARGVPFHLDNYEYSAIQAQLDWAYANNDVPRWCYFQHLRASADGRYDFPRANLNELVEQTEGVEVRPESFRDWVRRICGEAQLRAPPPVVMTMTIP
ncbi:unnamed protein product [Discula destructiva]